MKKIEEIKNEVAVKHGYKDWHDADLCTSYDQSDALVSEAMQEYAKQRCDEDQSRNKELIETLEFALKAIKAVNSFGASAAIIKRIESVLNTPNVVTTK